MFPAVPAVVIAGQRGVGGAGGKGPRNGIRPRFRGSGGRVRDDEAIIPGRHLEAAVAVRFSVTIRQVREDGSEVPLEGELAAALAAPAEQFAGLAAWAAEEAGYLDHGEQGEGDRGRGPRAAAAAAAGHVRHRRRPRAAGRASHQRRRDDGCEVNALTLSSLQRAHLP